jgi:Pyridine nucleotide-disulphide oxidoreductase.
MEKHETIIIGAGPGGLTAAKELAKKGQGRFSSRKKTRR